jgi:hypothetical protein
MLLALLIASVAFSSPTPGASTSPSPSPSANASPSPSASPTAAPGFSVHGSGTNAFIDQATGGPGQVPPEGAAFAAGNPAAPMSPYDWFSTAPETPGVAGQIQYFFDAAYRTGNFTANATFVASGTAGDVTNAIYWGEPILGPLDPHEGRSPLPYRVAFPTHAGSNDATGVQAALYNVSIGSSAPGWNVTGGYVAPSGFDSFVYTPTALTSWLPSLNLQTFESVGPAIADVDGWNHAAQALPSLGVDATATFGHLGVEATDGLLPALPGSAARMSGFNAALDEGDAGRFSFDVIHVNTSGDAVSVPTLFGSDPQLHHGAQGDLATSTLGGQTQTIAGARAFFHPLDGYDLTVELARSWYDATLVARPGTSQPGNYQHFAVTRHFGSDFDAGAEYYRFDPRYSTAVLPYGIPENVWGIAWAYPGPWLKGTYQLAGNNIASTNREGFRVHADYSHGRFVARAAYYGYRQVDPSTYGNLTQTGFVEVDYLVEAPGDVTYGQTRGAVAYLAWKLPRDTFAIDFARDSQFRPYNGTAIADLVDMRYEQLVLSEQHTFTSKLLGVAGYGRYSSSGTWSTTPVVGIYGLGYAGGEWAFDGNQQLLITVRRYGLTGIPSIPGGPPPTLRGTALVVDHHIRF